MRLSKVVVTLVFSLFSAVAVADYVDIEGGWHTSAGEQDERDTMTIRKIGSNLYEVELRTVYCPSTECMNARISGFSFKAEYRDDSLSFKGKGCHVLLQFPELNSANIHLTGCIGSDWFAYEPPRSDFARFSSFPDWAER